MRGPTQRHGHGVQSYTVHGTRGEECDYVWPEDQEFEVRRMVYEAYRRADSLQGKAFEGAGVGDLADQEFREGLNDDIDFNNLIQECVVSVFNGCSENRMQCGIVLMTLCTVFGVSHNFLSALLT